MANRKPPYFEDVELGAEIGPLEAVAEDEAVVAFCQLWGNPMPNRFTDPESAGKARLPGPIVPGIMSMAMMARLLTDWAGPEAMKELDLVFRQTVPHNRAVRVTATVTDLRQEAGENLVQCDLLMTSAAGDQYIGGKAVLALPSRLR